MYIDSLNNILNIIKYIITTTNNTNLEGAIKQLNDEEYNKLFKSLQINQFNNYVLLRYGIEENINNDSEYESAHEYFWNYNNKFYRMCRSIVVDINTFKAVLVPFNKFFNLGELEECSLKNIEEKIKKSRLYRIF